MKLPDKFHITLKEYRILATGIIIFFAVLTWSMWAWFQIHHAELTMESATVFGSLVLLSGGGLKFALENIMKKHEADD